VDTLRATPSTMCQLTELGLNTVLLLSRSLYHKSSTNIRDQPSPAIIAEREMPERGCVKSRSRTYRIDAEEFTVRDSHIISPVRKFLYNLATEGMQVRSGIQLANDDLMASSRSLSTSSWRWRGHQKRTWSGFRQTRSDMSAS
jgi:hypothetical protein